MVLLFTLPPHPVLALGLPLVSLLCPNLTYKSGIQSLIFSGNWPFNKPTLRNLWSGCLEQLASRTKTFGGLSWLKEVNLFTLLSGPQCPDFCKGILMVNWAASRNLPKFPCESWQVGLLWHFEICLSWPLKFWPIIASVIVVVPLWKMILWHPKNVMQNSV